MDEWRQRYEQLEKDRQVQVAELEEKCMRLEAEVATSLELKDKNEMDQLK